VTNTFGQRLGAARCAYLVRMNTSCDAKEPGERFPDEIASPSPGDEERFGDDVVRHPMPAAPQHVCHDAGVVLAIKLGERNLVHSSTRLSYNHVFVLSLVS
jgi:hypothetical protein